MLPDFTIITHKFPERHDIVIYPIADVHLGAAEHNAEAWGAFCRKIEQEENAYVILAGDLINNSLRNSIGRGVYEDFMRPHEQKKLIVKMLTPLKDKILCSVRGNHEYRSAKDVDDDPSYDIMAKMDLEHLYRENMAFLRLQFGDQDSDGLRNPTYILAVMHGSGGGQTGSMVNKGEKTAYFYENIDALIFGHSHKPFITQPAKISVDARNNKVSLKPFKVISCTSWMNYGGYAMQKMMPPVSIAPQTMKLYGKEKKLEVTM